MRRTALLLTLVAALCLFVPVTAKAQAGFVQVTGTVIDPQLFPYSNGTVTANLVPSGIQNALLNGKQFNGHPNPATMDLNGHFLMQLADNNLVTPASTQWQFTVCGFLATVQWPIGRASQCFNVTLTITGSSMDISSQLQAAATSLTNVCPNSNLVGTPVGCGGGGGTGCTVTGFADQSVLFIDPLATCAVDTNLLWDPTTAKKWLLVGGPAPIRPGSFDNFDTIFTPEPDWNDTQGTFARIVTLGGHTINSCIICVAAETAGDSTGVGGNLSGMEIVSWDNAKEVSNGGPYGIYLQTGSNNATGSTSSTTIGVFNKLFISGAGTTDNLVPFWAHTEGLTGTAARHANGMGFYAEGLVDVAGANHIFDTYADFLGDLAGHSGGEVTAHCGLVIGTVCGAPGSGANGGTWSLLVGPLGVAGDSFRAKINADLFVNGKITLGQDGTSAEGYFDDTEIAVPGNPSSGFERWFGDTSGRFRCIISTGANCGFVSSRYFAEGTALVSGDFALGAGWGSTAAMSAITGTDQAFNFTVTTGGSGIAANPTTTLTFHDGTWTNSPIFTCTQTGGNDVLADVTFTSGVATATTLPMIWNGTPTTAKTYIISCVGMGR